MKQIKDIVNFDRDKCPYCCERGHMSKEFIEHLSKRPMIQCSKCGCAILLDDGTVIEPKFYAC